jgi:hypothetical protein
MARQVSEEASMAKRKKRAKAQGARRRAVRRAAPRKAKGAKPARKRVAKRRPAAAGKQSAPEAPRPIAVPGAWPFPMTTKP